MAQITNLNRNIWETGREYRKIETEAETKQKQE